MLDPKTQLQAVAQIIQLVPEYRLSEEIGPAHNRRFKSAVRIKLAESNELTAWLVGPLGRAISEADQFAAQAYLGLVRSWIEGGNVAALRLFRNPSDAATMVLEQASDFVIRANLRANEKQFKFLQRIRTCILPAVGLEPAITLKRLRELDAVLKKREGIATSQLTALRKYAVPGQTAGEIESLLGSLSQYLNSVKPETWDQSRSEREHLFHRLVYLPSLLKWFVDNQEVIDLRDTCRRLANSGHCTVIIPTSMTQLSVRGVPGLINWLIAEISEELRVNPITVRLSDDSLLEISIRRDIYDSNRPNAFFDLITKCKDALLFGAGIENVTSSEEGVRLSISLHEDGPLAIKFLEEGTRQLSQLVEFGVSLHDVKNVFAAIDVLSTQAARDESQRYRCHAEMQEKLQKLRGLMSALKLMSGTYRQPKKRIIDVDELVAQYRQRAILMLPPSIDFSTYGDHGGEKAFVEVDLDLIFFALDNIVKNSREAVHKDSAQIRLEWVLDRKNQLVLLSIRDNGLGMSEEALNQVLAGGFSTKKTIGGSGLGLRSVRRIIESHDGKLTIQSQLGIGTHVDIELFLAQRDLPPLEIGVIEPLGAEDEKSL